MRAKLVRRLRKFTRLPIAVGFGISTPAQFAEVGEFADAAVVGSAIVQAIEQAGRERAPQAVAELISVAAGEQADSAVSTQHSAREVLLSADC